MLWYMYSQLVGFILLAHSILCPCGSEPIRPSLLSAPWGRPGGEDSAETSAPSRFLSFALPVTECVVQRQGIVTTILYYCYAHTHTHAQTQQMRPSSCLLSVEVFAGQILIGTHTGTGGTHRVLGHRAGNAPLGRSTDRVRSLSEHTCRVSVESATQRLRTRQNHG